MILHSACVLGDPKAPHTLTATDVKTPAGCDQEVQATWQRSEVRHGTHQETQLSKHFTISHTNMSVFSWFIPQIPKG